jgi:hypothetical protein
VRVCVLVCQLVSRRPPWLGLPLLCLTFATHFVALYTSHCLALRRVSVSCAVFVACLCVLDHLYHRISLRDVCVCFRLGLCTPTRSDHSSWPQRYLFALALSLLSRLSLPSSLNIPTAIIRCVLPVHGIVLVCCVCFACLLRPARCTHGV